MFLHTTTKKKPGDNKQTQNKLPKGREKRKDPKDSTSNKQVIIGDFVK